MILRDSVGFRWIPMDSESFLGIPRLFRVGSDGLRGDSDAFCEDSMGLRGFRSVPHDSAEFRRILMGFLCRNPSAAPPYRPFAKTKNTKK